MGCDIHMYHEVKIDGTWYFYGELPGYRNYRWFCRIGGVRCSDEIECDHLAAKRGLPEDASVVTKYLAKHWEEDGHSFSYMNSYEVGLIIEEMRTAGAKPHEFFGDWEWCDGFEDKRVVFWFDN